MTIPQERREELREAAEGHLRYGGGGDDLANGVLALLDALTRTEAQSEARCINTTYWKGRAREVKAERDEWRQIALDERGAALDLLHNAVKDRDARIADTLALCDEWAAMGTRSMNIGAVRRALGGEAGESTALARAEARLASVERMRDTLHLNYTTMSGPAVAAALTRALEE